MKFQTLQLEHLRQVLDLQTVIEDRLKPDEKKFILHRDEKEYATYLEKGQMLGVFNDEGALVAQMIYKLPQGTGRDYIEFLPHIPAEQMVIYEAIAVHPDYRDHQLMMHMLKHIEKKTTRQVAIIQIAADNPASWLSAMKYGMDIAKADYDPQDNTPVYYLMKELKSPAQERGTHHPVCSIRHLDRVDLKCLFRILKHTTRGGVCYALKEDRMCRLKSAQKAVSLSLVSALKARGR